MTILPITYSVMEDDITNSVRIEEADMIELVVVGRG